MNIIEWNYVQFKVNKQQINIPMENNGVVEKDLLIYSCSFEIFVQKAHVLIKFPCNFFLQWKTINAKHAVQGKNRPSSDTEEVVFQQSLVMTTEMIFNKKTKQFMNKETHLNLNLISKSRKDQMKLIGRVKMNLADLMSNDSYGKLKSYKLSYCSVDAELVLSAALTAKELTNMHPNHLDRSSFSDYLSLYAPNYKDEHPKPDNHTESQQNSFKMARNYNPPEMSVDNIINKNKYNKHVNHNFMNQSITNRIDLIKKHEHESSLETIKLQSKNMMGQQKHRYSHQINPNVGKNQFRMGLKNNEEGLSERRDSSSKSSWDTEKHKFKGEIDNNREKIIDLQRKITRLSANIEDKNHFPSISSNENDFIQKQQLLNIIKSINNHEVEKIKKISSTNNYQEYNHPNKNTHYQHNLQILKKQTDELRKIWKEKKEYYEEKISSLAQILTEKEEKIHRYGQKLQEQQKYKYQCELLKDLMKQKEEKERETEKEIRRLQLESRQKEKGIEELQVFRKVKMEFDNHLKIHEEVLQKLKKNEGQIEKYRENYLKMETAYNIQSQNYDNTKLKHAQAETSILNLQHHIEQIKNQLLIAHQQSQKNLKNNEINMQNLVKLQELTKERQELKIQIASKQESIQGISMEKQLSIKEMREEIEQVRVKESDGRRRIEELSETIEKLTLEINQSREAYRKEINNKDQQCNQFQNTIIDLQQTQQKQLQIFIEKQQILNTNIIQLQQTINNITLQLHATNNNALQQRPSIQLYQQLKEDNNNVQLLDVIVLPINSTAKRQWLKKKEINPIQTQLQPALHYNLYKEQPYNVACKQPEREQPQEYFTSNISFEQEDRDLEIQLKDSVAGLRSSSTETFMPPQKKKQEGQIYKKESMFTEYITLKYEHDHLQEERDALIKDKDVLEKQLQRSKGEMVILQQKYEEVLNQRADDRQAVNSKQREEMIRLSDEMGLVKYQREALVNEVIGLKYQLQEKEKYILQLDGVRLEGDKLKEELLILMLERDEMKRQRDRALHQQQTADNQKHLLLNQLMVNHQPINILSQQKNTLRTSSQSTQKQLTNNIHQQQARIDTLNEQITDLQQQIISSRQRENELTTNLMAMEQECKKILYMIEEKEFITKQLIQLKQKYISLNDLISQYEKVLIQKQQHIQHLNEQLKQKISNQTSQDRQRLIQSNRQQTAKLHTQISQLKRINQSTANTNQQLQSKIQQYLQQSTTLQHQIQFLSQQYTQITEELQFANSSNQQQNTNIQQYQNSIQQYQNSIQQHDMHLQQLRQQIEYFKQYQQEFERREQVIENLQQEKFQLEVLINQSNNQYANYNQQLENKIEELHFRIEKYEQQGGVWLQERRGFQVERSGLQMQKKNLQMLMNQLKQENTSKSSMLAQQQLNLKQIQVHHTQTIQQKQHQIDLLKQANSDLKAEIQKLKQLQNILKQNMLQFEIELRRLQKQSRDKGELLQKKEEQISKEHEMVRVLQKEIEQLKEGIRSCNQLAMNKGGLEYSEKEMQDAAFSILQIRDEQYEDIQNNQQISYPHQEQPNKIRISACSSLNDKNKRGGDEVIESRSNKTVQLYNDMASQHSYIDDLANIREELDDVNLRTQNRQYMQGQRVKEIEKTKSCNLQSTSPFSIYPTFTQFHKEEMAKIIKEQQEEINQLEKKLQQVNIEQYQRKICDLQQTILNMKSTYRQQLQKMLTEQQKYYLENSLSIINEDPNQDDGMRSSRSIINFKSRIKSCNELFQLQQRLTSEQQSKTRLQRQLQKMEQQKFNLLTVMKEKEEQLEVMQSELLEVAMGCNDQKMVIEEMRGRNERLQNQMQFYRNHYNFGESGEKQERRLTRSEPTNEDHDKVRNQDYVIECLRAQVQRYRSREDQLAWNIKDLQMQLHIVNQNLLIVKNTPSFIKEDSVFHHPAFMQSEIQALNPSYIQEDIHPEFLKNHIETTYRMSQKEKLLMLLQRNEQFKQILRNLIKLLKAKEKEEMSMLVKEKQLNEASVKMQAMLRQGDVINVSELFTILKGLIFDFFKVQEERDREIVQEIQSFEYNLKIFSTEKKQIQVQLNN